MNGHATAKVDCLENAFDDGHVQTVKNHFQGGQNKNLIEGALAQYGSECDQAGGSPVVSTDECGQVEFDFHKSVVDQGHFPEAQH